MHPALARARVTGQSDRQLANQDPQTMVSFSHPRCRRRLALMLLLMATPCHLGPVRAEGQVQLRCTGTLLETRGQAELTRLTRRLLFTLAINAEAATADQALALLQRRLAAVRSGLQSLDVTQLQVSSPSSWQRPAQVGQPAAVQASLQVSGSLEPTRLQPLIRGIGALAGVQLSPVRTEADRGDDLKVRQELLRLAYQDALRQARPLADLIGSRQLQPLEIRADGVEMVPIAMRAMAADGVPPFNPQELEPPKDRLGLQVRFCAL